MHEIIQCATLATVRKKIPFQWSHLIESADFDIYKYPLWFFIRGYPLLMSVEMGEEGQPKANIY